MFKYIYKLLFPSNSEKLRNQIENKYEKAIALQRNGNIREYSIVMKEIADLEEELLKSEK
jgi:hypothetical protein